MSELSSYALGTNQINLLTEALSDAETSTATYGKYAKAYELLFSMLSEDENGNAILSESDALTIDYNTWSLSGDKYSWEKVDADIDDGAWVFLRGVAEVNLGSVNPDGESEYSQFIREYSKLQYYSRFGLIATDAQVQAASDKIAEFILKDILNMSNNNNPNHFIPTIDGIAVRDAQAAAEALFTENEIEGWAGNPFLVPAGHDDSYRKNILHDVNSGGDGSGDTYDVLSVFSNVIQAAVNCGVWGTLTNIVDVMLEIIPSTSSYSDVWSVKEDTELFIENAYGENFSFVDSADRLTNFIVGTHNDDINLSRIITHDNEFPDIYGEDIVHAGLGDDHIMASTGDDIIDGGQGEDLVDYSSLGDGVGLSMNFENVSGSLYSERINVHKGIGLFDLAETDLLYGIENIKLTSFDDSLSLKGDFFLNSSIDTEGGSDKVNFKGVGGIVDTGADDDSINFGGQGNVVYTGTGADKINMSGLRFGGQGLIADASTEDRIYNFGAQLDGAIKHVSLESPWAYDGMVRYSINQVGELVIENILGGELYVSNFNKSLFEAHTADIVLGEIDTAAYTFFHGDRPDNMDMGTTLEALKFFIKEIKDDANTGADPLVLDLDGDGVELTSLNALSPSFDVNNDNFSEWTGWVKGDDGLLAVDANSNGVIDGQEELFGDADTSGFAALSVYDSNLDGVIDALDTEFSDLKIWQDSNENAITDVGELKSLSEFDISSITLTPDMTTPQTLAGNLISAIGHFTYSDSTTGEAADVIFDTNTYHSEWLEDVTLTPQAEAMPNIKGHGTVADLHHAMSYDSSLIAEVTSILPTLNTPDLSALRASLLPLLSSWADTVPVPLGAPGTEMRIDVPILTASDPIEGTQVEDFGILINDQNGSYWQLASGTDVLDGDGEIIERPSLVDIQTHVGNGTEVWETLDAATISFMERWTGLNMPIGIEGGNTGTDATNAAKQVISFMWTELNDIAVHFSAQGGLSAFFQDIEYDAESESFIATSDSQLVPMMEQIFLAAPADSAGALAHLEEWKPYLDIVLNDFARANGLETSYAYLFQNVVAAYENVGLSVSLVDAAKAFSIPESNIITGSGVQNGTHDESELFYMDSTNQIVDGGRGADSYIFGHSFGQDVIEDYEDTSGVNHPDTIRFAHHTSSEIILERDGNDLLLKVIGESDEIRVVDQFEVRVPNLFGGFGNAAHGISEIIFADGVVFSEYEIAKNVSDPQPTDDILLGTGKMDYLDGGAGNDKITGGNEGDVYVYGQNYGQDQIADHSPSYMGIDNPIDSVYYTNIQSPDVVYFKDLNLSDLSFVRSDHSDDLKIEVNGTTDTLEIFSQFRAAYTGVFGKQWHGRIESFAFENGDTLQWDELMEYMLVESSTENDDSIYGFSYQDVLDGGAGNDYLSGGNEADTYIFGRGYGHDVIFDNVTNITVDEGDVLQFTDDVQTTDILIGRGNEVDDLKLTILDTGESVTLLEQANQFAMSSNFNAIDEIKFSDNTVWDTEYLQETYLAQQTTAGDDTIIGFTRHDIIEGGAGNDRLEGRGGGDTYLFDVGHGNDVVHDYIEYTTWDQDDTFQFGPGILAEDVNYAKTGDDLLITYQNSTDSIIIEKFFRNISFYQIEKFVFDDGTILTETDVATIALGIAPIYGTANSETLTGDIGDDRIYGLEGDDVLKGGSGNDLLDGGIGNDNLQGASGDDAYIASSGDDYIKDIGGIDTIVFGYGISLEDIEVTRQYLSSWNVHLEVKWEQNSIFVDDHFATSSRVIEYFEFADGSVIDIRTLVPVTLGTEGNDTINGETASGHNFNHDDTIYGYGGNDTLRGKSGDDILIGGDGDDSIEGGSGNDVYVYESGDDTYKEGVSGAGEDIVRFDIPITQQDISISQISSYDISIDISGYGTVVIEDQSLWYGDRKLEKLQFEDNTELSLLNLTLGTDTSETLSGDGSEDIMFGGDGADILEGFSGDDLLYGENGDDDLYGGDGDDIFYSGDGSDTITGNGGADIFSFDATTALNDIDTITDFDPSEGDALDIADLLFAYDPLEDALADFIEITDDGTDSAVKLDMDGTGTTHSFAQFATLEDVTGLTDEAALLANGNLII